MKNKEQLYILAILACIVIIALVAWHAVQEIHYLKSFYPRSFSVAEAGWAAIVELIKVLLISFPLLIVITLLAKRAKF